ncbi:DUF1450 domain-containing protein [Alicyclobacillus sp. SO9]|uniref:DUF1450 domain-containing protein n=1 Tax=Alicyclobacillus sp. SO9 TaxID=2665646 RepID=UPI0018E86EE7|nr:DUF1450 domain-containing protein [Alicyclobacillus sp. SO9]QQE78611.1 DUF1450 domain-containing protein [Alicyclobacillus sp. SO9]
MNRVTKIEVCTNNLFLGTKHVCNQVADNYPDIEVTEWECLGYCHLCYRQPAVLINDTEYVQTDKPEELWKLVQEQIEKRNTKL